MSDAFEKPRCAVCGGPVARFNVWQNPDHTQTGIAECHGMTERHTMTLRQADEFQRARREGRVVDFVAFASSPALTASTDSHRPEKP